MNSTRGKCLVVDDNPVQRMALSNRMSRKSLVLENGGELVFTKAQVETASGRVDAMTKIQKSHEEKNYYSHVFTDMNMAGDPRDNRRSGAHLIQDIRKFESTNDSPRARIIVYSTESDLATLFSEKETTLSCGEGLENDFQGFFPKPFTNESTISLTPPPKRAQPEASSRSLNQSSPAVFLTTFSLFTSTASFNNNDDVVREERKRLDLPKTRNGNT